MGLVKQTCLIFFLCLDAASLLATPTEIVWYGHSAFKIVTPNQHVLLIDPWIDNPFNPQGQQDLAALDRVDVILITHGHEDHVGNAVQIAKKTGAQLVTTYDLAPALIQYKDFPVNQVPAAYQGNFGGTVSLFNETLFVHFVPAVHSSAVITGRMHIYGGDPAGFLIEIKDGPTIYHTGDTALFSDMKLIPQIKPIDLMLVCIGGVYTMDPQRAAQSTLWLNPQMTIPMHYGTFPLLTGTPKEFEAALHQMNSQTHLVVPQVGIPVQWPASKL